MQADPDARTIPSPALGVPLLTLIFLVACGAIAFSWALLFRPNWIEPWTAVADGSGRAVLLQSVHAFMLAVPTLAVLLLGYALFQCMRQKRRRPNLPQPGSLHGEPKAAPPSSPQAIASRTSTTDTATMDGTSTGAGASPAGASTAQSSGSGGVPMMPAVDPAELARRLALNRRLRATVPRITKADLAAQKDAQMWVAIRGHVFDVSSKRSLYAEGGSYRVFVGKDASRLFATASVKDTAASDDIHDLPEKNMKMLDDWFAFYMQRYPLVALLTDSAALPASLD